MQAIWDRVTKDIHFQLQTHTRTQTWKKPLSIGQVRWIDIIHENHKVQNYFLSDYGIRWGSVQMWSIIKNSIITLILLKGLHTLVMYHKLILTACRQTCMPLVQKKNRRVCASFVFYLHVAVISSYILCIAISEQEFSCDFWSCPLMFCSHPQYYAIHVLCDVNAAYAYTGYV